MIEASCDYHMTYISLYLPFKMICNNSHLEAPYGNIHAILSARDYLTGKPVKNDTSLSLVPGMQPFCYDDNPNVSLLWLSIKIVHILA